MIKKSRKFRRGAILALVLVFFLNHTVALASVGDPSVTVSNYLGLCNALSNARDGAVIGIKGVITVPSPDNLDYDKCVTLKRMEAGAKIVLNDEYGYGGTTKLKGYTFEGNSGGVGGTEPFIYVNCNAEFSMCEFNNFINQGNTGGAVFINSGEVLFSSCRFEGNTADYGGAFTNRGTATVDNCYIIDNWAEEMGGAIYNAGTLTIKDTEIKQNTARIGGGLYSYGSVTVNNSLIWSNTGTAQGADLALEGSYTNNTTEEEYNSYLAYYSLYYNGWETDLNPQIGGSGTYLKFATTNEDPNAPEPEDPDIGDDGSGDEEPDNGDSGSGGAGDNGDPVDPPQGGGDSEPTDPPSSDPESGDNGDTGSQDPATPSDAGNSSGGNIDNSTTDNSVTDNSNNSTTDNSDTDNSNNSTTDNSVTDNSNNSTTDNSTTDNSNNSVTDNSQTTTDNSNNSVTDNSSTDNSQSTTNTTTDNSQSTTSTTDNHSTNTDNHSTSTDNHSSSVSTTDNHSSSVSNVDNSSRRSESTRTENSNNSSSTTNTTNNYYQSPQQEQSSSRSNGSVASPQPVNVNITVPQAERSTEVSKEQGIPQNIHIEAEGVNVSYEYTENGVSISIAPYTPQSPIQEPNGLELLSTAPKAVSQPVEENNSPNSWVDYATLIMLALLLALEVWDKINCKKA